MPTLAREGVFEPLGWVDSGSGLGFRLVLSQAILNGHSVDL